MGNSVSALRTWATAAPLPMPYVAKASPTSKDSKSNIDHKAGCVFRSQVTLKTLTSRSVKLTGGAVATLRKLTSVPSSNSLVVKGMTSGCVSS